MAGYDFDAYQGRLYRVFEGTVLEGVVTNHIDGGLTGPILIKLTTDYYSHDHQQLLMPQGTRLIGTVQSVGNAQQRKMSDNSAVDSAGHCWFTLLCVTYLLKQKQFFCQRAKS
jgi:Bacterial conjugation TrbI-like protein